MILCWKVSWTLVFLRRLRHSDYFIMKTVSCELFANVKEELRFDLTIIGSFKHVLMSLFGFAISWPEDMGVGVAGSKKEKRLWFLGMFVDLLRTAGMTNC